MPGQGAQKRPKKLKVEKAEYGQQLGQFSGPGLRLPAIEGLAWAF